MELDRRHFLIGLPALFGATFLGWKYWPEKHSKFIAARALKSKNLFWVGIIDPWNQVIKNIPIDFQGHSIILDPKNKFRAIMFGHHPSPRSCEIDLQSEKVTRYFQAENDQHFYGHGAFSPDGQLIYSTDNNYKKDFGVINVRENQSFKVIDQLPTFGPEPHELLFTADGSQAIIANGGIQTRPSFQNGEQALGPLRSSVAIIQTSSKTLLHQFHLDNPMLSLRHLAQVDKKIFCAVIQDKSFGTGPGGLVVFFDSQGNFELSGQSPEVRAQMQHHTLSIKRTRNNEIAVTSPNGNLVTFWDADKKSLLKTLSIPSASGLAIDSSQGWALATSHAEEVYKIDLANKIFEPLRLRDSISGLGAVWGAHLTTLET